MTSETLRDHFAASALTGLLCNGDFSMECIPLHAFSMADAMLRERSRAGQIGSGGTDSAAKCTERDSANLDASPEARASEATASPERVRVRGDAGTGDTDHGASPEARASGESVVPQPTPRGDSDRTDKAAPRPSDGTGDTPATHATQGEGSVRREGTEPVAWGVASGKGLLYTTSTSRIDAVDMQSEYEVETEVVPLYRHPQPTLTDAEREAIKWAAVVSEGLCQMGAMNRARTLLGILERLK